MTLTELYQALALQYGSATGEMVYTFSDKGSMYSYIEFYQRHFEPRQSAVSLLEIGIMTGGSLHLWQTYFRQYRLVGIDLSDTWSQHRPFQAALEADKHIELIFGVNSRLPEIPASVQTQQFDFVIDDGDHTVLAQMDTFHNYWPTVADGNTYFIEDVVGTVQIQALKNFLSQYQQTHCETFTVEYYAGFKNARADDQILAVTRL